jgi:nitrate/nitrite transport system substrate-binding protein
VSNRLAAALDEHKTLPAALATLGRKPVFAQTFPTGTHAMWLYYWLASQGVHPLRDIDSVVIPPPQMVDALAQDRLDGLCVGEPWNAVAQERGVGRTIATTSEVWPDHPEKVLASRRDFVTRYPNTARALVQTMLEACRWLDDAGHRVEIARSLAADAFLGVPAESIASRLIAAGSDEQRRAVKFFENGAVNYPHPSEGAWFFAQYARWGMADWRDDFARIAQEVNQTALYRDAAARMGVDVHAQAPSARLIDGRVWDGAAAAQQVEFPIRA